MTAPLSNRPSEAYGFLEDAIGMRVPWRPDNSGQIKEWLPYWKEKGVACPGRTQSANPQIYTQPFPNTHTHLKTHNSERKLVALTAASSKSPPARLSSSSWGGHHRFNQCHPSQVNHFWVSDLKTSDKLGTYNQYRDIHQHIWSLALGLLTELTLWLPSWCVKLGNLHRHKKSSGSWFWLHKSGLKSLT